MKELRISFCTVCRNRLYHLKETILKNIEDNNDYQNLEFILLDYNSDDGLWEYIKENLKAHIETGRLVYYKTTEPRYFNRTHSRNLAFRLATGDILCNLDADNFTGKGFAEFVNSNFINSDNIFLSATGFSNDVLGRICVIRKHFEFLKGFDETMVNYGFEDFDFINRLELLGVEQKQIKEPSFLHAIKHSNAERISEEPLRKTIYKIMVHQINYYSSTLLFLFENGAYEMGTIINEINKHSDNCLNELEQPGNTRYEFSLAGNTWEKGSWEECPEGIQLQAKGINEILYSQRENIYTFQTKVQPNKIFCDLTDAGMIDEAVFFHSQVGNRIIMTENLKQKKTIVNEYGFGQGSVSKNFKNEDLLVIL